MDELKKFKIGQGFGWLDVAILKDNGFNVYEGTSFDGLFKMVAYNRVDLFPRGINELFAEFESRKKIKGLDYDKSIALYYPLPRFFFTNKSNVQVINRLKEGLYTAYKDGSFNELWHKFFGKSVKKANLKNRRIFKIENPFLKGIDKSYEKFIYEP